MDILDVVDKDFLSVCFVMCFGLIFDGVFLVSVLVYLRCVLIVFGLI